MSLSEDAAGVELPAVVSSRDGDRQGPLLQIGGRAGVAGPAPAIYGGDRGPRLVSLAAAVGGRVGVVCIAAHAVSLSLLPATGHPAAIAAVVAVGAVDAVLVGEPDGC